MNEDSLLTMLMAFAFIISFFVYYIMPVAGVVVGVVLLKKKPEKKALGITILLISIAVCAAVAVWKITDLQKY